MSSQFIKHKTVLRMKSTATDHPHEFWRKIHCVHALIKEEQQLTAESRANIIHFSIGSAFISLTEKLK